MKVANNKNYNYHKMFKKIKDYRNSKVENFRLVVHSHLIVMIAGHILAQFLLTLGVAEQMETKEGDFNVFSLLTVVVSLGGFLAAFFKSFNKSKIILTSDSQLHPGRRNYATILFYGIVIIYWIPLFLSQGVSGLDRGEWRNDNARFFTHHTCPLMLPVAMAAVSDRSMLWYNRLFICLLQNLIMVGIGEQFTGLVMNLPLLGFLLNRKQLLSCVAVILVFSVGYKSNKYFNLATTDMSVSSIREVLSTRIGNEAGQMNSIVNQRLSWKILDHPKALVPYQKWGLTDKPLVMLYTLNDGIYNITLETGGLVTGTIVEVMSFLFSPWLSIITSYLLGIYSGWLLVVGIYFVNSNNPKKHFLGILTFLVYQLRVMPIVHSGVLTSFLKLDHIVVVLILWISLKETDNKLALQS